MELEKTELPGVMIIHNADRRDGRGGMETVLDETALKECGISFSAKEQRLYKIEKSGTFFGIHYQTDGSPQDKIVQVLAGRGVDYVVDLRADSPTSGKWISVELCEGDKKAVYIPHGCGHAFFSTEDDTWQLFTVNEHFHKDFAKRIHYKDPAIGLVLPGEVTVISDADRDAPML